MEGNLNRIPESLADKDNNNDPRLIYVYSDEVAIPSYSKKKSARVHYSTKSMQSTTKNSNSGRAIFDISNDCFLERSATTSLTVFQIENIS